MIAIRHMWSLTLSGPFTPFLTHPARGVFLRRSMTWRKGRHESMSDASIFARQFKMKFEMYVLE